MVTGLQLVAYERAYRFGPCPDESEDGKLFWESACDGMVAMEEEWKKAGKVFAWIDKVPVWVSAADWRLAPLPDPEEPCTRVFTLPLLGGRGHVRITERFYWWGLNDPEGFMPRIGCKTLLRTCVEEIDGCGVYYNGVLSGEPHFEMSTYAAVFPKRVPQLIVDRTAATLRQCCAMEEHLRFLELIKSGAAA